MSREGRFWREKTEYHDLAELFDRNIERDWEAYDYVTSRRMCSCLDYVNKCSFPLEGKVVRIEYQGPKL
jgi:hypothetical protein